MATNHPRVDDAGHGETPAAPNIRGLTISAVAQISPPSISESSDEGYRLSPAAARRFARRHLRRTSPTPDLVTSLVRPPSPDTLYVGAQAPTRIRDVRAGAVLDTSRSWVPNGSTQRRSGPLLPPHPSSLDIPQKYGGDCVFDLYSLTYVNEPDPNLLCPICHDPLVDPVTTPCDHTFCYRCLRRSIASSPSGTACPIDREPLSWLDCFSAARLVRTQLNNLIVKCPNQNRGCIREVRREGVESHATVECRFNDFKCPGADCDRRLRSKPTGETCLHHQIQCQHCDAGIEAADQELHLLSCTMSKTRCEACWELVGRNQLSLHRDQECDGVEVACPFQDVGCPVRAIRGQMHCHTLTCAFHPETPSGIIIRSQRELIESYENLGGHLREVHVRQDETNRRIDDIASNMTRRRGRDAVVNDNHTIQDLDAGFEEIHQNLTHLEARQSMWTLNQVMPIREEVTELRNNINMIRMHVNWLLNRSREEGRIRAANNPGSSTNIRRDSSGEPLPGPPERRRSSSTETDLPRL